MSYLIAAPEFVSAAASDLAKIGSTISAADAAAQLPTTSVLAAGADEVSVSIAALFGAQAQAYRALGAKAAAFHSQFVQLMNGGDGGNAIGLIGNGGNGGDSVNGGTPGTGGHRGLLFGHDGQPG